MKKSLISMICFTLLVSFFCSTSQVHAVNFEGQEDKYMKLCSSKSLSNSNYNTCKQFNSYLKKKNNQLQSSIDVSKFQGLIDWQEVKKHIDFAIIRCGYGSQFV